MLPVNQHITGSMEQCLTGYEIMSNHKVHKGYSSYQLFTRLDHAWWQFVVTLVMLKRFSKKILFYQLICKTHCAKPIDNLSRSGHYSTRSVGLEEKP